MNAAYVDAIQAGLNRTARVVRTTALVSLQTDSSAMEKVNAYAESVHVTKTRAISVELVKIVRHVHCHARTTKTAFSAKYSARERKQRRNSTAISAISNSPKSIASNPTRTTRFASSMTSPTIARSFSPMTSSMTRKSSIRKRKTVRGLFQHGPLLSSSF